MSEYQGRLVPYMDEIRALHAAGIPPMEIARRMAPKGPPAWPYKGRRDHDGNVTALSGLVRHALRLNKKKQPSISDLEKRVAYFREQLRQAEEALAARAA